MDKLNAAGVVPLFLSREPGSPWWSSTTLPELDAEGCECFACSVVIRRPLARNLRDLEMFRGWDYARSPTSRKQPSWQPGFCVAFTGDQRSDVGIGRFQPGSLNFLFSARADYFTSCMIGRGSPRRTPISAFGGLASGRRLTAAAARFSPKTRLQALRNMLKETQKLINAKPLLHRGGFCSYYLPVRHPCR